MPLSLHSGDACRSPKLRKALKPVLVTMLQAAPHTIHFKRILNFGEGQASALPKPVRQQISKTYKRFPARGCAGQASVETRIEDECFSGRIAYCPKIPRRLAAQERLRKVPNFARKGELPDKAM